ncbi:transketolase family protein [Candidatus Gracilibacteria bacterium]|nr:transketolase family protein [Candidatus Gracilibacteria bacterium]
MIATRKAFGEALVVAGDKYKNLVVLDADLTTSVMAHFYEKKFPERHFNIGISEQDLVDTAAGMAMAGKLPIACSFSIFLTGLAWQQIRNAICYPNMNVKLVGSHGGIQLGEDGATHQALEDFAIMRVIPNMKVFCAADAVEMKKMLPAVLEDYGPAYIRLGRQPVPVLYDDSYEFKIGKGSVLMDGDDVGIIAIGSLVGSAYLAAQKLRDEGISVRVVNMSTLKPIDARLIEETARKVGVLVTAEDHQTTGGLAGAVAEVLCETYPRTFYRIGMHDRFGESGKTADLYKKHKLDADGVYEQIKEWLGVD